MYSSGNGVKTSIRGGGDSVPTPPAEGDVPSPWTPLATKDILYR